MASNYGVLIKNHLVKIKSIILRVDHKICEMPHFISLTTPNIYIDLKINIIEETVKITQIHYICSYGF